MKRGRLIALVLLLCAGVLPFRAAPGADPRRFALVIGIQGYPGFPEDERLHWADRDAEEFAAFLKTRQGGQFDVKLLRDGEAKREDIYAGIDWLGQAGRDDVVYVFFSGHGVVDRLGLAYLMPWNGRKNAPAATGIRTDSFLDYVKRAVSSYRLVFFIDACHAGAASDAAGIAKGNGDGPSGQIERQWRQAFAGLDSAPMGFLSASASQESYEDNKLKHGLFTYYLLAGLRGAAEPGKGVITAGALQRYLYDNVSAYSRKHKPRVQTPIVTPSFTAEFPLASHEGGGAALPPPAPPAPPASVKSPPPKAPPGPWQVQRVATKLKGFVDIWGSGAADVWIAAADRDHGGALHYDGYSVTEVDTIGLIQAIWGSGPDDVWALGNAENGFPGNLLHWDGSAWSNTDHQVSGSRLWGSGPSDIWRTSFSGLERYDGRSWSLSLRDQRSRYSSGIWEGIWGSGPRDIWAVGRGSAHFDGKSWTLLPTGTPNGLDGVWGSGPRDVWAVGDHGTILHFDGTRWSTARSGGADLSAVWGSGPDDVWAVGQDRVLHFNGAEWRDDDLLDAADLADRFRAIWGSGPDDIWIGGASRLLHAGRKK